MEPEVMELICLMPVLHFKPIPKRAKQPPGLYECPCYYYPNRQGGIGRDSYMLRIDLKTGDQPSDFWVKRGTALLMSTAQWVNSILNNLIFLYNSRFLFHKHSWTRLNIFVQTDVVFWRFR